MRQTATVIPCCLALAVLAPTIGRGAENDWAEGTPGLENGASRDYYNRAGLLPWWNFMGDWSDAVGVGQGDAAFAITNVVDDDTGKPMSELRVDGGAAANDPLMQMQADFLQIPVVRPTVSETTALGAAYLAGLATGVSKDDSEIAGNWQVDRRFEPRLGAAEAAGLRARWQEAVQRSRGWEVQS